MARQWNPERIVAAIRAWHEHDPTLRRLSREDQGLYCAAIRYFGSWPSAVRAAGLTPFQRKWTRQGILDAIRTRHEGGLSIRGITSSDPVLYSAAVRHFGSWAEAMRTAGLPWNPKPARSAEYVVAAIRRRHQQGLPLQGIWKTDRRLTDAAWKHFGSWAKAVAAAGIADGWQQTWTRHPPPQPWTPERVIEAIQVRQRAGLSIASIWRDDHVLYSAASRCFGNWPAALRAAGLAALARPKWSREVVLR